VAVIVLLLAAHLACFVASVVLLDAQRQYIEEVDSAGTACIAMHRMAIDCRCACVRVRDSSVSHAALAGLALSLTQSCTTWLNIMTTAAPRVLDALYRGIQDPAIFTPTELDHYLDLFGDAVLQFEAAHEATYLGHNDVMRRFVNRQK
jgi:hypothetical protein